MRKITKFTLITALVCILCFNAISVSASESLASKSSNITPRWTNLSDVSFTFLATSSGGYVDAAYESYSNTFSQARISVKLQKRFLLLFWTDVDEWSSSSNQDSGILSHVFTLDGAGTYRATFTFEVIGTDGTVDTVTKEIESSY